jgi:hypothetical protein
MTKLLALAVLISASITGNACGDDKQDVSCSDAMSHVYASQCALGQGTYTEPQAIVYCLHLLNVASQYDCENTVHDWVNCMAEMKSNQCSSCNSFLDAMATCK